MLFTESDTNMLSFLQELTCLLGEARNQLIGEESKPEEDTRIGEEEEDRVRRAFR